MSARLLALFDAWRGLSAPRRRAFGGMAFAGALLAFAMVACSSEPPKCSSDDVISVLRGWIIDQMGIADKNMDVDIKDYSRDEIASLITFKDVHADSYDAGTKKRICQASATDGDESIPISYEIQLDDNDKMVLRYRFTEEVNLFTVMGFAQNVQKHTKAGQALIQRDRDAAEAQEQAKQKAEQAEQLAQKKAWEEEQLARKKAWEDQQLLIKDMLRREQPRLAADCAARQKPGSDFPPISASCSPSHDSTSPCYDPCLFLN